MKRDILALSLLAGLAAFAASPATGCGEGQFNMGQGLKYQAYLAPRPATVLVYSDQGNHASPHKRVALIAGLRASGHRVTEVHDSAGLADALRGQQFDVLIASYAAMDSVAASAGALADRPPRLLPVVARAQRNAPEVKSRFAHFVLDGASLGQYLKTINSALPASAP